MPGYPALQCLEDLGRLSKLGFLRPSARSSRSSLAFAGYREERDLHFLEDTEHAMELLESYFSGVFCSQHVVPTGCSIIGNCFYN